MEHADIYDDDDWTEEKQTQQMGYAIARLEKRIDELWLVVAILSVAVVYLFAR